MKYFLHDSNSFNDEKITELFINYGYEGLGLFYTILEKLALQEKPVKTSVLKSQLKVGKKLEKCWSFMESLELISSNNGDTFNKQLLNFSGKYAIKKEKNAKRISEWRENQEDIKNVTRYEHICNTPKVKESKVNKIEESEIKEKSFSPISHTFELTIDECKKQYILDAILIESVCMNLKRTNVEILALLDSFSTKLITEGVQSKILTDFKSHFIRWAKIQTSIKAPDQSQPTLKKKYL